MEKDKRTRSTKSDLLVYLAQRGMTQSNAAAFLQLVSDFVSERIASGSEVIIPDIGILKLAQVKEKVGRNLSTGESVAIPAHLKIKFQPAKQLREALTTFGGAAS